jgi:hypothetical protein
MTFNVFPFNRLFISFPSVSETDEIPSKIRSSHVSFTLSIAFTLEKKCETKA